MTARLGGVCAAVITPFDEQFRPDAAKAVPYYARLLQSGCDALNVMGTTGEAMSIAVDDRLAYMEAMAASDLPLDRMMVGTGATSLRDAIRLTKAAFELGFANALVMPPPFYRNITDAGVVEFFYRLFDASRPPADGILLYNFPAMSGITFHADLVDRLAGEFGAVVGGMKDSSNDRDLQREVHRRHPHLRLYPGSEVQLNDARENGYAGCISGSVALWPALAARIWSGEASAQAELTRLRESLAGLPLIPAVRHVIARSSGEAAWERCVPPQMPLDDTQSARLREFSATAPLR